VLRLFSGFFEPHVDDLFGPPLLNLGGTNQRLAVAFPQGVAEEGPGSEVLVADDIHLGRDWRADITPIPVHSSPPTPAASPKPLPRRVPTLRPIRPPSSGNCRRMPSTISRRSSSLPESTKPSPVVRTSRSGKSEKKP
jgi:hypothetical protein